MFKRKIEGKLQEFYQDSNAKTLIVTGARQIGKSFIIRNTANKVFSHFVEINLKTDYLGEQLFLNVKTTKDFYIALSVKNGDNLGSYDDTMIFLDEIQVYPHLLSMLKPLREEKRYRYIASGSLLGVTLKHVFIPMGSIDEVNMYPMDFEEFLWANKVGEEVIDYLKASFAKLTPINESIHDKFLSLFKDYLVSGGLPDAVIEYVINRNVKAMRKIQNETIQYYKDDYSQYDLEHKLKIFKVYDMLQSNMGNKVKRIQFKKIDNALNANLSKYEDEFDYLISSGIALSARAITNPIFPLSLSKSKDLVKFYYNDVGLLTNFLYRENVMAVLNKDRGINLGSVYETVVANELVAHGHELFYFDSKKVGEVDFLINNYNDLSILPIEVKSGNDQTNFRAIPKLVDDNGSYKLPYGYVFGNKNIVKRENNLVTLPIYLVMFL